MTNYPYNLISDLATYENYEITGSSEEVEEICNSMINHWNINGNVANVNLNSFYQILCKRYFDNKTYDEIANELGITVDFISNFISRALSEMVEIQPKQDTIDYVFADNSRIKNAAKRQGLKTIDDLKSFITKNQISTVKEFADAFRNLGYKSAVIVNSTLELGLQ